MKTATETFDRNHQKIASFIQKYIPYHMLVCVEANNCSKYSLPLAQKNISKANKNERVITESISTSVIEATDSCFLEHLALSKLSKVGLRMLYNNYIALLYSKQIAELTQQFTPLSYDVAMQRIIVVRNILEKEQTLVNLRTQIKKKCS